MANKTVDEYIIYAFSDYKMNLFGVNKWRFVSKGNNLKSILQQARQLHISQQYQRIEVKKKSFNPKSNKYRLSTYEVFGKNKKISLYKVLATALLIFAFCGQLLMHNIISL